MIPDVISKILGLGACVEITFPHYNPGQITQWVALAKAQGGHITVEGLYSPEDVVRWAALGRQHFTFRCWPPGRTS